MYPHNIICAQLSVFLLLAMGLISPPPPPPPCNSPLAIPVTRDLYALQHFNIHIPRASSYFAVNLKLCNLVKCSIILAFRDRNQYPLG